MQSTLKVETKIDVIFFSSVFNSFSEGKWLNQFATFRTTRMNFTLISGSPVLVDMMRNNKERLNTQVNPAGLKAISCEVPYVGSTSMTVLLPHKNSSIQELEASLTPTVLNRVLGGSYYVKTDLFLPKFNINFKADVN